MDDDYEDRSEVHEKKYPVNREFFPLNHFTAPSNIFLIRLSQKHMNAPRFLWKDPNLHVEVKKIPAYQGGRIELYILAPKTAGDSAGGALAVTSCLLLRERRDALRPIFQMLFYPWLDGRNISESHKRYTDVAMWNAELSEKITPLINPHPEQIPLVYRSPIEAETFEGMPPAYVEVAEFDALHDDGVLYARLLTEAGIACELHETKGTIHGFDTKVSAPTSQKMIAGRIAYMRTMFFQ